MDTVVPSRETLRELAVVQGVDISDDDIENVLGFLRVLYPALRGVEAQLPEEYEP